MKRVDNYNNYHIKLDQPLYGFSTFDNFKSNLYRTAELRFGIPVPTGILVRLECQHVVAPYANCYSYSLYTRSSGSFHTLRQKSFLS
jgi:hypothetical protein